MNKDKRSLLIIHHGQGVGGGLIALLGLIDELRVDNDVHVLSIFDGVAVDYLRRAGVTVSVPQSRFYSKYYRLSIHSEATYFNVIDFFRNIINLFTFFLSKQVFAPAELKRISKHYDVVYLNSTFITDWGVAAHRLKKKVVIHVREPLARGLFGLRRSLIRMAINRSCQQIIAVSHDNASRIGLPSKTTVVYDPVVTNGRDSATVARNAAPYKYFLYLGGMARIKGFEQLAEAVEYMGDDVRVYFLGGEVAFASSGIKRFVRGALDPYYFRSQRLFRRIRSSNKVIFVGLTDDVFSYYRDSYAVICPFSKPHAALPILEGFSMGLPVIASNIVGMSELVNQTNGMFFENSDARSLARSVNEMASMPADSYEQMRAAAYSTYVELRAKSASVTSVIKLI